MWVMTTFIWNPNREHSQSLRGVADTSSLGVEPLQVPGA